MIHLISAFRNAEHRLQPYFDMVAALRATMPRPPRVMAVVGDSTDGTEAKVRAWVYREPAHRWWFRHDHGVREYGSTEVPARLQALSGLLNASLDESMRYVSDDDTVIWCEGDLFWDPFTILQLDRFLRRVEVDVVAPMVFAGEAFYDTWGFRTIDNRRWGPFWPWGDVSDFTQATPLIEMGSVGSCVAMRGAVAKVVRVQDGQALVGWAKEARQRGSRIWCAKELRVQHPFDLRS